MKHIAIVLLLIAGSLSVNAQKTETAPDPSKKIETLKATCGSCQWGMKAQDCTLAVKFEGKNYFVQGTDIDAHGDAHAKNGFCNTVRKAEVQGMVVDDKFVVTYFKLLSDK